MKITLTVDDLIKRNACSDGVDLFRMTFGESIDMIWDREHQEYLLLTEFRRYVGWAWLVGLLPQWTLNGWVVRSANLRSADLRYADLRSANLESANLRSADLTNAWRPQNAPDGWEILDGRLRRMETNS